MSQDDKPAREWQVKYAEKSGNIGFVAADGPVPGLSEVVHVIEYKAYDSLKADLDEAMSALEFYGDPTNWDCWHKNYDSLPDDCDEQCIGEDTAEPPEFFIVPTGGKRAREVLAKLKKRWGGE